MPLINGEHFYEDSRPEMRSPEGQFLGDDASLTRSMFILGETDEDRRYSAAECLLGYNIMVQDNDGLAGATRRWIERQMPHGYVPGRTKANPLRTPFLRAMSIPKAKPLTSRVQSVDSDGRPVHKAGYSYTIRYQRTLYNFLDDTQVLATQGPLDNTFGAPARPDEGDALRRGWTNSRYVTRFFRSAPRTITLPGGIVKWVVAPKDVIGQGFPFQQFRCVVNYIWHKVPIEAIPFDAIKQVAGCANFGTFDFAEDGTLALISAEYRAYADPLGDMLCDLTYQCAYIPNRDPVSGIYQGWNSLPRRRGNQIRYDQVSADGNVPGANTALYPDASYDALFRPPQG